MPDDFVRVARTHQLPPGKTMLVELDHQERILLANVRGSYHAVEELCPHSGAALSDGQMYVENVECPLHGSQFSLETGRVLSPPASDDLIVYQVSVEGEDILVGPPSQ